MDGRTEGWGEGGRGRGGEAEGGAEGCMHCVKKSSVSCRWSDEIIIGVRESERRLLRNA